MGGFSVSVTTGTTVSRGYQGAQIAEIKIRSGVAVM